MDQFTVLPIFFTPLYSPVLLQFFCLFQRCQNYGGFWKWRIPFFAIGVRNLSETDPILNQGSREDLAHDIPSSNQFIAGKIIWKMLVFAAMFDDWRVAVYLVMLVVSTPLALRLLCPPSLPGCLNLTGKSTISAQIQRSQLKSCSINSGSNHAKSTMSQNPQIPQVSALFWIDYNTSLTWTVGLCFLWFRDS